MRKAGSREVAAAVISLALNLAASPAFAAPQAPTRTPARDLSELRFLVRRGDTVFVTSESGDELKASVVGVVVDRDAFLVDAVCLSSSRWPDQERVDWDSPSRSFGRSWADAVESSLVRALSLPAWRS